MFGLETFIFCAGIIYLIKLSLNLLWDIKNGVYAYILPRMCCVNYKKKYGGWAVVTGCTQGIGKCYAEELAQKGLNVVLISRTKLKLETVANELTQKYGIDTNIIVADFTDPKAPHKVIKELEQLNIDIGVLVNNVGMLGEHQMPFLELDESTVIGMINVNMLAATILCHSILPKMKKKGKGAIINISSIAAYFVAPYLAVYAATKHYMSAFTLAIAAEYADSGVDIQCVEPGAVETAMTKYFDESAKIPFAYPTAKDYTNNAFRTLGISGRTSGYFGHSLFLWIFQKICTPTENSLVISNAVKQGKEAYENALIMKQKKQ